MLQQITAKYCNKKSEQNKMFQQIGAKYSVQNWRQITQPAQ
jgi:cytochrome c551/c552